MWEIIYTEISVGIYILELVGGGRPREANGDEHDGNPLKKIVQQYIWGTSGLLVLATHLLRPSRNRFGPDQVPLTLRVWVARRWPCVTHAVHRGAQSHIRKRCSTKCRV